MCVFICSLCRMVVSDRYPSDRGKNNVSLLFSMFDDCLIILGYDVSQ